MSDEYNANQGYPQQMSITNEYRDEIIHDGYGMVPPQVENQYEMQ